MACYKLIPQLFIDHDTNLISIYTKTTKKVQEEKEQNHEFTLSETRICLPFKLFNAIFYKLHTHGHAGTKISTRSFSQYYLHLIYINGFLYSFMIVLIVKRINITIQKYKQLLFKHFSEHASYFNYRISMDTKGPINPSF